MHRGLLHQLGSEESYTIFDIFSCLGIESSPILKEEQIELDQKIIKKACTFDNLTLCLLIGKGLDFNYCHSMENNDELLDQY